MWPMTVVLIFLYVSCCNAYRQPGLCVAHQGQLLLSAVSHQRPTEPAEHIPLSVTLDQHPSEGKSTVVWCVFIINICDSVGFPLGPPAALSAEGAWHLKLLCLGFVLSIQLRVAMLWVTQFVLFLDSVFECFPLWYMGGWRKHTHASFTYCK